MEEFPLSRIRYQIQLAKTGCAVAKEKLQNLGKATGKVQDLKDLHRGISLSEDSAERAKAELRDFEKSHASDPALPDLRRDLSAALLALGGLRAEWIGQWEAAVAEGAEQDYVGMLWEQEERTRKALSRTNPVLIELESESCCKSCCKRCPSCFTSSTPIWQRIVAMLVLVIFIIVSLLSLGMFFYLIY